MIQLYKRVAKSKCYAIREIMLTHKRHAKTKMLQTINTTRAQISFKLALDNKSATDH